MDNPALNASRITSNIEIVKRFLAADFPGRRQRSALGATSGPSQRNLAEKPTAPKSERISLDGVDELGFELFAMFDEKEGVQRGLCPADDEGQESSEEGGRARFYARTAKDRTFLVRQDVSRQFKVADNCRAALRRVLNRSHLDFSGLRDFDLEALSHALCERQRHSLSALAALVLSTGLPLSRLRQMRIRCASKRQVICEGIWVGENQISVVFKPFSGSLRKDPVFSTIQHSELLRISFSCSAITASAVKALSPSIPDLLITELKQLLQDCNARTGSVLTIGSLQDAIYRDFLLYVRDTDLSQATAVFGRNLPLGYVASHYRAHDLKRLQTLRRNADLRLTQKLLDAYHLKAHMLGFDCLKPVNDKEKMIDLCSLNVQQVIGSNRVAETQRLQELQVCLRNRVVSAKKDRELDLSKLHNCIVDYMYFWLLMVHWLRPTKLLFLRNYFINLKSGKAFLSQKDDEKFTHSTVIHLTASFIEQCEQLIELKRLIARTGDIYAPSNTVDLRLTEAAPTSSISRKELTKFEDMFNSKTLKDCPLLAHVVNHRNSLKLKPVCPVDLLRELGFDDLVANVGRHFGPSICRNSSPEFDLLNSFYLDDLTVSLGTSHSSLGNQILERNSNADIRYQQSRLLTVAKRFEALLGFGPLKLNGVVL